MRKKNNFKISKKAGSIPGSMIHLGEKKTEKLKITIIDYDKENFEEKEVSNIEECFKFKEKPSVTWINIDGLHDVETIEKLGNNFGFHPLILEDIVNTQQRPKTEDFDDYLFIVLKMLRINDISSEIEAEQISIILGENFVISFQEYEGDVFTNVRERIRKNKGRIRKLKADYLSYSLVDAIVDNYFAILENYGEKIEYLENNLIKSPEPDTLEQIYKLKRTFLSLRKSVWPLRELIVFLTRGESELIAEKTSIYFRDVYDHIIQIIDTIESFRDMVTGMLDIYLSSVSNKMNEVMKVLTIFAAIFIPLTFLAGIYGMNFDVLPELHWKWSYLYWWISVIIVAGGMLFYFKKKKWL